MKNYEQQAQDFLNKTNTTFKAEFIKHGKHFDKDTNTRDIYKITLSHGNRSYSFNFGQSIKASGTHFLYGNDKKGIAHLSGKHLLRIAYLHPHFEGLEGKIGGLTPIYSKEWNRNSNFTKPTAYDVLAGLQKYEPGTFEDFCSDFGYEEDSRTAERVYKDVCDEYINLKMLFSDEELAQLQEIQ